MNLPNTQTPQKDGQRIYAMLKPWMRFVWLDLLLVTFIELFMQIFPSYAQKYVVDVVIPHGGSDKLYYIFSALFSAGFAFVMLMVWDEYCCHVTANNVMVSHRIKLFKHLQKLPFSFFSSNKSGEVMSRLNDDPQTIYYFLAWNGSTLMAICSALVMMVGVLVVTDWRIALLSLVLGWVFYHLSNWASQDIRPASKSAKDQSAVALERMRESVSGMALCRVLGTGAQEVASARSKLDDFRLSRWRLAKAEIKNTVVGASFHATLVLSLYSLCLWLLSGKDLSLGSLFLASSLATAATEQMRRLLRELANVRAAGPALDRSDLFLSLPEGVAETSEGLNINTPQRISFENVVFTHPGSTAPVLNGVTFQVQRGERVALVGRSGSGKSTLMDVLLRLHEWDSGDITFDGVSLRALPGVDLRKKIGVVSQDVQIRTGTLLENVQLGDPNASVAQVEGALRRSGLGELLDLYGVHMEVGERGRKLSGGQRQRLSLARVLLKRSPILILDEASSALDAVTEQDINSALLADDAAEITFIISHRLSTVLCADRILVLDNGKVVESGTHEKLMAQGGIYTSLFEREERGV